MGKNGPNIILYIYCSNIYIFYFLSIFRFPFTQRLWISNLVILSQLLWNFIFWYQKVIKKDPLKKAKNVKMTFFKNPKKCFCAATRGVYISNLKGIGKKLWPLASGQTDRRTDGQTDGRTDRRPPPGLIKCFNFAALLDGCHKIEKLIWGELLISLYVV